MTSRHYNLPSLSALAAFEAAARHLSFKNAANELNVTPGAVSHQVKALEHELNSALFHRQHRGVELTQTGKDLFITLQQSFSNISVTLDKIRQPSTQNAVTIGATSAVSSLWLTGALIEFWKKNPDITVDQNVSDTVFVEPNKPDLVIQYGANTDKRLNHHVFYRDELIAVCSPKLASDLQHITLKALAEQPLVHLQSSVINWTTWQSWFCALGYDGDIQKGFSVNNYTIALQAAQDDGGIVLGWKRLIRPLLTDGRLVQIGNYSIKAPNQFYIISKTDTQISADTKLLRDWLINYVTKD
jgi:LysR family glycine cleavage system transcriptional activator